MISTNQRKADKPLASLLTLPEVFKSRLFSIPDYQRGYAWEKEQIDTLHDDIEHLLHSSHIHYTGTIVITPTSRSSRPDEVFDIIDGQQRLTSLVILLCELIRKLENGERKSELYDLYVYRGEEGNGQYVFKLNRQIDPYFRGYVIDNQSDSETKTIEYLSEENVKVSKQQSLKWIEKMIKQGNSIESLINLITSQLGFIVYRPESNAESGMMFEVINNRGKPLSELEKVKNYLIYYAIKKEKGKLRQTVDDSWGEILKSLARAHKLKVHEESTFLRGVCATFFGFNKKDSSDIYNQIKKRYSLDNGGGDIWKHLQEFVLFMKRCAFYYEALLNESSPHRTSIENKDVVQCIELIRSQTSFANILPVYFALMDKRSLIRADELVDAFRMLEIFNFRVYMTRNGAKRTDRGQGPLYFMAYDFFFSFEKENWLMEKTEGDEPHYKSHCAWLIGALYDLVNKYNNDDRFVEGLRLEKTDNDDFYGWGGLRYFLMNYERQEDSTRTIKVENILKKRSDIKSNDYYSIEHIWATANKTAGKKFQGGEDELYKRRLGNFVLLELGVNSRAKHKDLPDKIQIYNGDDEGEKSVLKQVELLIRDFRKVNKELQAEPTRKTKKTILAEQNMKTIEVQEDRYVQFARNRWAIDWVEKYWEEA